MDPMTAGILTAAVLPLVSGAAGEAGRQAWGALMASVRERFGRGSNVEVAAMAVDECPDDVVRGETLGAVLAHVAEQDDEFAVWLRDWLSRSAAVPATPSVANTISDGAQVRGHVIQAHTISGPITLG